MSEPTIAQPVSQSIAIMRAAGGGVEHLAVDGIVSLSGIKPFGGTPSALTGATQVHQEQQDRSRGEKKAQRLPRRAIGEEPADHRWPRFQSSSRAWMMMAMPISAMAISTQRRVSR
ncbi:hypothetical protein SAMN02746000_03123 [Paracoccus sp. J56]|nr:hypothetical protein SAMN02746000_03123 [Paracoccus sp. J56]